MSTKVSVNWLAGQKYLHEMKARQHRILSDAPVSSQGGDQGATPHEIFLLGLGGCVAMTVEMFAASKGWDLKSVRVSITEDLVDDQNNPGVKIPSITEEIEVEGNLSRQQTDRLLDVAKRCPVYKLFVGKKLVDCRLELKLPSAASQAAPSEADEPA